VILENCYPRWETRVDRHPVPVGRVNYVLAGLVLPAGARHVELSFTSPRYERAKVITLASIFVALAALVGGAGLERRAGTRPQAA
jgi:uncharacterized membrane protein YfhO